MSLVLFSVFVVLIRVCYASMYAALFLCVCVCFIFVCVWERVHPISISYMSYESYVV